MGEATLAVPVLFTKIVRVLSPVTKFDVTVPLVAGVNL